MDYKQPRRFRDERRKHAIGRYYDAAWKASAREYKILNPFCLGCLAVGERSRTAVVDHIVPHRGNRTLFDDPANRQPACEWHHNAVKPILEARYERGEIDVGCLRLNSQEAIALTKSSKKTEIGTDGWPK